MRHTAETLPRVKSPRFPSFDTFSTRVYDEGITEKGGGPVLKMSTCSGSSDCSRNSSREVADS